MPDGLRAAPPPVRLHLAIGGAVQGVGFRPHVYRVATALGLAGFVRNAPFGVEVEIEGPLPRVDAFLARLTPEAPAHIASLARTVIPPRGESAFAIADSSSAGAGGAVPLPDLATCDACVADIFSPGRHHGYAFTACAACGPRFSAIADLPYDRARTALAGFALCADCARGYADPLDRRFHAETQACPVCGPALTLLDRCGQPLADPLRAAAGLLRGGGIVAVKGIGGFHLLARADDERAVRELRARKQRARKPFAVMFPTLAAAAAWCEIGPAERAALTSPAAPIVLLRRAPGSAAAEGVAPGNPRLGAVLPYAPVHHLLLAALGLPLVATSANRSGEPLIYRDADAPCLADAVLGHNRPILRPVEDSVVQVLGGAPMVLRLGRGFAPRAVPLAAPAPPLLALGARLKNAPAIAQRRTALLGPHLGDLDHPATLAAQNGLVADLCRMHGVSPQAVACDAHPDDAAEAARFGLPVVKVQHHLAHVAAAMAEHGLPGPVLGLAWDGAGWGPDGTVWGGEFLLVHGAEWRRVGHLRQFRLPGGDAAAREPVRAAVGVLAEMFGTGPAMWPADLVARLDEARLPALCRILPSAPVTSSAGRLFDAVSALLGLCRFNSFEGEAAMALEALAGGSADALPAALAGGGGVADQPMTTCLDWSPAIAALLADLAADLPRPVVAARFYRTLVSAAVALAVRVGVADVVLTGGCFQSGKLAADMAAALKAAGLRPYLPAMVPPGDGGLALGQLEWARRVMATG